MEPTDADLMRQWQRGDARAFEVLVRRHQDRVARLLSRLSGAEAVDLCQDVFLRVYRAGPRYREEGAFSTWLYRIVLNVARDAGRRPRLANLPLSDDCESKDDFAPPDALCRRETVERVRTAVAHLPETQREVLVLRHYEGLSFEEMARLTGTPATTLKSRFAAALLRLRSDLAEFDPKDTRITP